MNGSAAYNPSAPSAGRSETIMLTLFGPLLAGDALALRRAIELPWQGLFPICVGVIIAGAGIYGAAMGWWRCGMQAFYTGLKIPLVILSPLS